MTKLHHTSKKLSLWLKWRNMTSRVGTQLTSSHSQSWHAKIGKSCSTGVLNWRESRGSTWNWGTSPSYSQIGNACLHVHFHSRRSESETLPKASFLVVLTNCDTDRMSTQSSLACLITTTCIRILWTRSTRKCYRLFRTMRGSIMAGIKRMASQRTSALNLKISWVLSMQIGKTGWSSSLRGSWFIFRWLRKINHFWV